MSNADPAPETQPVPQSDPHARWKFVRDVAVFEFKLFLNSLHSFLQIPLTLLVAAIDLVFKSNPEGDRFYRLLEYGRTIDDSIDIYSVVAHRERSLNADYTVDALVKKLEGVIIKEYEKGGTAASVKVALDKAIDTMQAGAEGGKDRAGEAIRRATEKIRGGPAQK